MMKQRHSDFVKIFNMFHQYIKDPAEAETEYYEWVNSLSIDESKPYANCQEAFNWAKDMIKYMREDKDNKYYQVCVGFPLESMNGNIYYQSDLERSASSIGGKHPSFLHKNEYWFKPESPWGEINTIGGVFEDGAAETIIQVPKTTRCPTNNEYMTKLIDEKQIVNVSLEGAYNDKGYFEFSDPPFTLLPKEVLPGIPIARIKPLEKIVSEAFTVMNITGKQKLKVTAQVKEDNRGVDQSKAPTINTDSSVDPQFKGTFGTPLQADMQIDTQQDNAQTVVGGSVADNYKMSYGTPMQPKMKGYEAAEQCPAGSHWDAEAGQCVTDAQESADVSPQPPDERTGPTRKPPGDFSIPNVAAPGKVHSQTVKGTSPCQQDSVNVGSSPVGESLPSLEERRGRIQAELLAKSNEEKAVAWEQKHNEAYEKLQAKTAQYNELSKQHEALRQDAVNERNLANQKLENTIVRMEKAVNDYNMVAGDKLKVEQRFQELTEAYNAVNKKYNEALSTNLTLSQKVTKANEDYLDVARRLESASEALERTRIEAKKILKVKV